MSPYREPGTSQSRRPFIEIDITWAKTLVTASSIAASVVFVTVFRWCERQPPERSYLERVEDTAKSYARGLYPGHQIRVGCLVTPGDMPDHCTIFVDETRHALDCVPDKGCEER